MEFGLLGPVVLIRDGREVALGGPKQRAVLAMLLLAANEIVPRERVIDGLWGEHPPASAGHTVDNYVSRLRKALGPERLSWRSPGYVLRVEEGELDVDEFERQLQTGHERLAAGDHSGAARALREALRAWRGPALADVRGAPFGAVAAARLEERRLQALEARTDADLADGCSAELVPDLERLVGEHPFRERPLGQLMLSLYRSGRQADALAAYQAGRLRMAHELGLEPGPELQELHHAILTQDPGLDARATSRWPLPHRAPAAVLAGVLAGAVLVVLVLVAAGRTGGGSASEATIHARAGPQPRSIVLPSAAAAAAAAAGSLWFALPDSNQVVRVDPATGAVDDHIPVPEGPATLASGAGSVWVARAAGDVIRRIDPRTGTVTNAVRLATGRIAALAFGAGALWAADSTGRTLVELDPVDGHIRRRIPVPVEPTALVVGRDSVWVADYSGAQIAQVDRTTGRTLTTVHVGNGPSALAVDGDSVWVTNALDSTVSRLRVATGSLEETMPVGSGPTAIAAADGFVWVANQYASSVSRIGRKGAGAVTNARVPGAPTALAAIGDHVWVATRRVSAHHGGTLRLLHTRPLKLDPALQADLMPLQSDRLTRGGLVAYNHVSGPAGTELVPDLAISIPTPTDGGAVYTFRLRPGIRYSDGRRLRASDFRRAIERALVMGSETAADVHELVGADACTPRAEPGCLSGGMATDDAARTVTFRLRAPDPDFPAVLTNGAIVTPVPPGTPYADVGFRAIPGTGPYKVARASAAEIRYVRNPYFHEYSHAAQPAGSPDQIVMRFGLTAAQQAREIAADRADWAADPVPASVLPSLRARYPERFHHWAVPATGFLQFNTTRAPFDDVRARLALNLAIDRREIVRLEGGPDIATPTCQILPPGLPGYRRYCPFTRGASDADLARARQLVTASGTRGQKVTVRGWSDDPDGARRALRYAARVLGRLGYRAQAHFVPHDHLDVPQSAVQVIYTAWGDTTNGMFTTWFTCHGANAHGWFCDPRVDRMLARAQSLKATDPSGAASIWAAIDRRLISEGASVPLVNERGLDFVSSRLRNYQFHPYWGLIADQLWFAR